MYPGMVAEQTRDKASGVGVSEGIFSFNSLASNMKMTLIWRKRKREITLQELSGKNQRENENVFSKKKLNG